MVEMLVVSESALRQIVALSFCGAVFNVLNFDDAFVARLELFLRTNSAEILDACWNVNLQSCWSDWLKNLLGVL